MFLFSIVQTLTEFDVERTSGLTSCVDGKVFRCVLHPPPLFFHGEGGGGTGSIEDIFSSYLLDYLIPPEVS